jgi:hypothetical protein
MSKFSNKQNLYSCEKRIHKLIRLLYMHIKTNDIFARRYLISIYIFQVSLRIFA